MLHCDEGLNKHGAHQHVVPMQISYALGSGKMEEDENNMHTSLFINAKETSNAVAPTLRNKTAGCMNTAVSARRINDAN
jgi:hypothetical protein